MQFNLDITTFNVNNSDKENKDFKKYEIDVSLNELKNTENECNLKYGYTFMSAPKGINLSIEGTIDVKGNSSEIESLYKKDEQNIPQILRLSYHELYPALFMITKSMKIPCPPYEISKTMELDTKPDNDNDTYNESTSKDSMENNNEQTANEEKQENEKLDSMTVDELRKLKTDLEKQTAEKPSDEIQKRIDTVNEALNKNTSGSVAEPQNVS
ncbi:MAG: hypothetical protein GWN01_14100 [Nitrosopumilaceae archaeon]|nr:hypothetical protein [Nitrosopumilaceae archaeon]NIU01991.1 hypothetical protein [Nitrosopumilaceae archaeon]NIU87142.1 hypothetical protein [Nitrosopumilaceae archaeon]NIV64632.1 hypothetical protein [Nitrosopumilaceae archaeon]NIX62592.1 hypothetical protein [Nitrosopumilaceae archaeon]